MVGFRECFFDIPIYRCTLDHHTQEQERAKQSALASLETIRLTHPDIYERAAQTYHEAHWYPWQYNETIGWLQLYPAGSQLRADLWFARAKRIVPGTKKRLYYYGKCMELWFHQAQTEEEIREAVIAELERIATTKPITGRYLHLECFRAIAPLLRWRALLGFETA